LKKEIKVAVYKNYKTVKLIMNFKKIFNQSYYGDILVYLYLYFICVIVAHGYMPKNQIYEFKKKKIIKCFK